LGRNAYAEHAAHVLILVLAWLVRRALRSIIKRDRDDQRRRRSEHDDRFEKRAATIGRILAAGVVGAVWSVTTMLVLGSSASI
jgi:type VI protein secretion system component VasK